MSLPINEVIAVLRGLNVPPDILIKAETQLETIEAEKKEEKAADGPKQKNKVNVVLLDPENKLNGDPNLTAIVTQIPEADDEATIPDRLYKATYAQNASGVRKKWNIKKLGEIGSVKRKHLKNENIAVKSGREPVRVLVVTGDIP